MSPIFIGKKPYYSLVDATRETIQGFSEGTEEKVSFTPQGSQEARYCQKKEYVRFIQQFQ